MISALTNKAVPAPRNSEAAIRMICRAVIRRVHDEYPLTEGYELFLRFWAAYPFGSDDELMQQIFHEEVLQAVGGADCWRAADPAAESDPYAYTASTFVQ